MNKNNTISKNSLKATQNITIPLAKYRSLVEMEFAVKVFEKFLEAEHYSSDVEDFAKNIFRFNANKLLEKEDTE